MTIGVASSFVSSIADYERALDYQLGARPLAWSALQGASLSVFENALNGRPLFASLGMDLGPGFISVRPWRSNADEPFLDYRLRFSSTIGALYFLGQGYEFNARESVRTGSLVFDAHKEIYMFGESTRGRTLGNTFAVYKPPFEGDPRGQAVHDVRFDWALPAHEKTHTAQLQKGDILGYPINSWALDIPILRYFRPGGEIIGLGLAILEYPTDHDDRIVEQVPEGVERAIYMRAF